MGINRQPFNPLGIDLARDQRLAFALTVRTTADHQWRSWRGTGISIWPVFEAGFVELQ